MKNLFKLTAAVLIIVFGFHPACEEKPGAERREGKETFRILAGFLPMYVFTMNVTESVEGVQVKVLAPPEQAEPHGFEMTPSDMGKVEEADVMVANGLGLETYMDRIKNTRPQLEIITASEGIEPLPEIPENRMNEPGEKPHAEGETGEFTPNPHVWVSPFLAARQVRNISEGLARLDPDNAAKYRSNGEKYSSKLKSLGEDFKKALAGKGELKLVTIHNAFDYLARDVGMKVVAVLRLDPRAEPGAKTLAEISKKIGEGDVDAICTEPQFPARLAGVLANETGLGVYELDPVAMGKPDPGFYEKVMRKNLRTLLEISGQKQ